MLLHPDFDIERGNQKLFVLWWGLTCLSCRVSKINSSRPGCVLTVWTNWVETTSRYPEHSSLKSTLVVIILVTRELGQVALEEWWYLVHLFIKIHSRAKDKHWLRWWLPERTSSVLRSRRGSILFILFLKITNIRTWSRLSWSQ